MLDLNALLRTLAESSGSDLHLIVGQPPIIRVDGELRRLPGNPIITGILKQERAEGALAKHKEPHQSSQLVKTFRRVITQKIENQRKLPQWVWVIEGPQFSPRYRPLDSRLKRRGLGNAPREPGEGREDQRH